MGGMKPGRKPQAVSERFFASVVQNGDCWDWTGTMREEYGVFGVPTPGGRYKNVTTHRWSYEYMVADIPPGLVLDHLCRRTQCVNPYHLDPVTQAVNNARAKAAIVTCPMGHDYDEENTYRRPDGGRDCRTCQRTRNREWARRARAAKL